jgi:hypothetical protein
LNYFYEAKGVNFMKRYIIPVFITLFLVSSIVESQSVKTLNRRTRANQRSLYRLKKQVKAMDKQQKELSKGLDNMADSLSGRHDYLMKQLSQNKAFSAMIVDSLASRLTGNLMAVEGTVRTFFLISGLFIMGIIAMIVFLLIKYLQGAPANTKAIDAAVDMVTDVATLIRATDRLTQAPPLQTAASDPPTAQQAAPPQPDAAPPADDQGFYLHIAEEIFRMNVRLDRMPGETKGVAALRNAVKRLEDELHMKGYTVVDLTGQLYDDGMTVMVRDFIPKDDIPRGQKKIMRMIKPQIKYQGNIVAHGEIEVAMSTEDLALKTSPGIKPAR